MDINTKNADSKILEILDYWKQLPVEGVIPLKLNQRIEQTITMFAGFLDKIEVSKNNPANQYLSFIWSVSVRNFVILLRDSLLASVKLEQLRKDDKNVQELYFSEIQTIIRNAAIDIGNEYSNSTKKNFDHEIWKHQESPIAEVISQLAELRKQSKKIYRSSSKIDDIRSNINDFVKDFQLQYSKQSNAVKQLFSIVEEVRRMVRDISVESSEAIVNEIVDQIGDNSQKLELVQGTESIDILPYASNEILNLPISTSKGNLNFKSINIKSEFARWFSSFIYPKIIELESKRDHAVEKCLYALSQIRTKIAAISLAEMDDSIDLQKDFQIVFSQLEKEVLEGLKQEEEETNALILSHQNNYLLASGVYTSDILFLPDSGSSQISNLSKDAQKRIVDYFGRYKKDLINYINKVLSGFVEVDKTPYSQYIKNQMTIYNKDDSLALFLKNGYLGKSFTVPRPELMNAIVEDYKLWLDGFTGAILLSGFSGRGKSTILGMINHLGWNEEIIQLNIGESYFVRHKSYSSNCDLKETIDHVVYLTRGRRIVVCIDDLELWHNEKNELFENITKLFETIVKYREKVFFVVACSPFLKDRIQLFKDLKSIFSSQVELNRMNSIQIRNALNLRARVNESANIEDTQLESRFGLILRESKGNIGSAMIEYCRFHNEDYRPNIKSQEFTELIRSYHTLLMYISTYGHNSIRVLSQSLSEMDYRDTMKSIDHLIGQKILIRPKNGYVTINPLLIHTIELTLSKLK